MFLANLLANLLNKLWRPLTTAMVSTDVVTGGIISQSALDLVDFKQPQGLIYAQMAFLAWMALLRTYEKQKGLDK